MAPPRNGWLADKRLLFVRVLTASAQTYGHRKILDRTSIWAAWDGSLIQMETFLLPSEAQPFVTVEIDLDVSKEAKEPIHAMLRNGLLLCSPKQRSFWQFPALTNF